MSDPSDIAALIAQTIADASNVEIIPHTGREHDQLAAAILATPVPWLTCPTCNGKGCMNYDEWVGYATTADLRDVKP